MLYRSRATRFTRSLETGHLLDLRPHGTRRKAIDDANKLMRIRILPYQLRRPPKALRTAQLDNIALVPASLLFHKPKYKAIARALPTGSVLICTPPSPKQCRALEKVASYFRSREHPREMI